MNTTFDELNKEIEDTFEAFRCEDIKLLPLHPDTNEALKDDCYNNPIKFQRNVNIGLALDKFSVLVISGVNALGEKNSRKIQEFLVSCIGGEYILQERANGDLEAIFAGEIDIYGTTWGPEKPEGLKLSNGNYQHVLANKPVGQIQLFHGENYHVPLVPASFLKVATWKEMFESPATFKLGQSQTSNKGVLKRKLTLNLTNEQLEKLEKLAKQEKTSKPEIIRRLIEKA